MMSGKRVRKLERERRSYFRLDYLCVAREGEGGAPGGGGEDLPFGHFKELNLIEYKSAFESLSEQTFRNYVGRALLVETEERGKSYQGRLTLTIVTSRRPRALLKCEEYGFEGHPRKAGQNTKKRKTRGRAKRDAEHKRGPPYKNVGPGSWLPGRCRATPCQGTGDGVPGRPPSSARRRPDDWYFHNP